MDVQRYNTLYMSSVVGSKEKAPVYGRFVALFYPRDSSTNQLPFSRPLEIYIPPRSRERSTSNEAFENVFATAGFIMQSCREL